MSVDISNTRFRDSLTSLVGRFPRETVFASRNKRIANIDIYCDDPDWMQERDSKLLRRKVGKYSQGRRRTDKNRPTWRQLPY